MLTTDEVVCFSVLHEETFIENVRVVVVVVVVEMNII